MNIKPGDKLIIFSPSSGKSIVIAKEDTLKQFLEEL